MWVLCHLKDLFLKKEKRRGREGGKERERERGREGGGEREGRKEGGREMVTKG